MIPRDGLGGVEQAARSLAPNADLDIETVFVCGKSLSDKKHIKVIDEETGLNSFKFYYSGFKYLLNKKPDLLVCSLWRVSLIGVLYSLFTRFFGKKKVKLVIFIHANKFAHIFDKLITKSAVFLSDEVWCDSHASKVSIFPSLNASNKVKVISFFVSIDNDKFIPSTEKINDFVFWGRIAKQKRLDRAIVLFKEIYDRNPESLFYIYGPDCGDLENLKNLVEKLSLSGSVIFKGKKEPGFYPEEALKSKFFINTSSHEGMAIAVVEAMQLGLVPIVTPVGEIANYCNDGINSIYYNEQASGKVFELICNETLYKKMSNESCSYWKERLDYSTDFNNNCLRFLYRD